MREQAFAAVVVVGDKTAEEGECDRRAQDPHGGLALPLIVRDGGLHDQVAPLRAVDRGDRFAGVGNFPLLNTLLHTAHPGEEPLLHAHLLLLQLVVLRQLVGELVRRLLCNDVRRQPHRIHLRKLAYTY